mmetsp:Transcript_6270/g.11490  ORF Transcript_6270/g.11490 Transcript_6270/m.11490 type:complete len:192 (-) Transcript_6270:102-677(-)
MNSGRISARGSGSLSSCQAAVKAGAGQGTRGRGPRDVSVLAKRKVVTQDTEWSKGLGSVGIFLEDGEKKSFSLVGRLADRKVLSGVEQSGLLSAAEKAGLTLSKVEDLKLLSTAEKLGVLSFLESAFAVDGATITSYSIPFFLGALGSLVLIPTDTVEFQVLHWGSVGVCLAAFTTLFVGGFVIKSLQEDD